MFFSKQTPSPFQSYTSSYNIAAIRAPIPTAPYATPLATAAPGDSVDDEALPLSVPEGESLLLEPEPEEPEPVARGPDSVAVTPETETPVGVAPF